MSASGACQHSSSTCQRALHLPSGTYRSADGLIYESPPPAGTTCPFGFCCRKRLTDTEAKLRAALQDKAAAIAEKGNLERQLKQFQGQKMLMEKTLEKKDALESKKRESIMVVRITGVWWARTTTCRCPRAVRLPRTGDFMKFVPVTS